ncbi:MAG: iron ABC transporter permease [Oscillospiraceae bacterium]
MTTNNNAQDIIKKAQVKYRTIILFLIVLPISIFIVSFFLGKYGISPSEFSGVFMGKINDIFTGSPLKIDGSVETVIFKIRLPRLIAATLVGAALSVAGVAYQGMFKNPLVSPDILGASAGAGFGASLAITLSLSLGGIQLYAFVFSIIAVMLVYFTSKIMKNNQILGLVLAGMLIGNLFSSFTSFLKFIADPNDKLPSITFWLMGGLSSIGYDEIVSAGIPIIVGIIPLIFLRWRINILTFGDEEARAMGINTKRLRFIVIFCATLITAASVSISGMIGWIGLVVPHISRMIVGPNYKILLPTTIAIGASYLLIVDNLARLLSTVEIPLGILTSIVGAPFFLFLILHRRRERQ